VDRGGRRPTGSWPPFRRKMPSVTRIFNDDLRIVTIDDWLVRRTARRGKWCRTGGWGLIFISSDCEKSHVSGRSFRPRTVYVPGFNLPLFLHGMEERKRRIRPTSGGQSSFHPAAGQSREKALSSFGGRGTEACSSPTIDLKPLRAPGDAFPYFVTSSVTEYVSVSGSGNNDEM